MTRTKELRDYEVHALVNFFTYTMDQEQRHRLMQNFPVIYTKLFPTVSLETKIVDLDHQPRQ